MLIDTIKKENLLALKNHDEVLRAVFSILVTKYMTEGYEAKAKGKEMSDLDMIRIIQKTLKELEEEKASYQKGAREDKVKEIDKQINAISVYLPKLMSEEEIKNVILNLEDKSVPAVMKHFKMNYAGKCDMGLVNKVVPLSELENETVLWAKTMMEHSPLALRMIKAGLNAELDGQTGIQELAGDATMLYYMTDEAQEGGRAFLEKRKPEFNLKPRCP